MTFILICESINIINIISGVHLRYSKSKLPTIFYNACLDPYTLNFSKSINEVMFFNQIIIYICDFTIIASNLFLYRFLKKQEKNNKGIFSFVCYFSNDFFQHWLSWMMQGTKRRKEKKILFLQMSGLLQCSSFSLTPWFNSFLFIRCENIDLYRYSSVFKKKDWDISARAFFWNLHVDIYYCIICPAVVLYGAPTIRRQWKKWKIFKLICKMKED